MHWQQIQPFSLNDIPENLLNQFIFKKAEKTRKRKRTDNDSIDFEDCYEVVDNHTFKLGNFFFNLDDIFVFLSKAYTFNGSTGGWSQLHKLFVF